MNFQLPHILQISYYEPEPNSLDLIGTKRNGEETRMRERERETRSNSNESTSSEHSVHEARRRRRKENLIHTQRHKIKTEHTARIGRVIVCLLP